MATTTTPLASGILASILIREPNPVNVTQTILETIGAGQIPAPGFNAYMLDAEALISNISVSTNQTSLEAVSAGQIPPPGFNAYMLDAEVLTSVLPSAASMTVEVVAAMPILTVPTVTEANELLLLSTVPVAKTVQSNELILISQVSLPQVTEANELLLIGPAGGQDVTKATLEVISVASLPPGAAAVSETAQLLLLQPSETRVASTVLEVVGSGVSALASVAGNYMTDSDILLVPSNRDIRSSVAGLEVLGTAGPYESPANTYALDSELLLSTRNPTNVNSTVLEVLAGEMPTFSRTAQVNSADELIMIAPPRNIQITRGTMEVVGNYYIGFNVSRETMEVLGSYPIRHQVASAKMEIVGVSTMPVVGHTQQARWWTIV